MKYSIVYRDEKNIYLVFRIWCDILLLWWVINASCRYCWSGKYVNMKMLFCRYLWCVLICSRYYGESKGKVDHPFESCALQNKMHLISKGTWTRPENKTTTTLRTITTWHTKQDTFGYYIEVLKLVTLVEFQGILITLVL